MNPIHEQFVAEARDLIQQTNDDLIVLERDGFDAGHIDSIMRSFHTLKGSAGVVQLPAMSMMLHAAEDVMIAVQAGRLFASSAVIEEALSCVDKVSEWVDAFEASGALPPNAGEEGRDIAERLRNLISEETGPTARPAPGAELPGWVSDLLRSTQRDSLGRAGDGPVSAILYEPHAGCFYDGDDPLKLLRKTPNLLALNIKFSGAAEPLASFDPFACRLRLEALAAGRREDLSAIFRNVPDQVRFIDVPAELLPKEEASARGKGDLVRPVLEEQRKVLLATRESEHLAGHLGAAARVAGNALRHGLREDLARQIATGGTAAMAQRNAAPLLAAIDNALMQLDRELKLPGPTPAAPGKKSNSSEGAAGRTLRIDESRIESLVNLAGELIVLKNSFGHLTKRMEATKASQELIQSAKQEYDRIGRLADEIQGAILQLRMVPFAQVLRAFPRLVRDLSQELGKSTRLVTQGETTECDKAVVDRLFEPLLHLVRNALDHGIEIPQERTAAGKEPTATLAIQATRAGDRIVVEVIDDGRGVDPAVIRSKAIESGLLTEEKSASLSDANVLDLIFAAGFSTAKQASDISGRGVGMDVVRTTVEQIGGRVTIDSRVGQGTTVRLDLPMNIATSRIMVVECAGQAFGVPMDHVVETLRLTPDRISEVKNNEGFVLRDRVVPICSLAELMNLPHAAAPKSGTRLVMVTETRGKVAAVEVDAIHDRMDVVLKPMQGLLSRARGYAGTTLMGDGAVLLVVDLKEVLP